MLSKHCDHPKRKLNSNLGKIIESLSNLEEINVSYHLVVHMEGTSQSFGTPNAIKVYEENEEEFRRALVDDGIDLCGAADPHGVLKTLLERSLQICC